MSVQVILTIPDDLYERAESLAQLTHQDVSTLLVESINLEWPDLPDDEEHRAMAREEIAYQAMHSELFAKYPGQHVAIYQGKLVDHDEDAAALFARVDKRFPDQIVLMTKVRVTPDEMYTNLSFWLDYRSLK